jgi:hypothetical protein
MCHFVSATLPLTADLAVLGPIAAQHHRALTPLHNSHVEAQLPSTVRYYLTTTGHCDCGTALGSTNRERPSQPKADTAKQIAAFQRRGWGAAKIARWLEQQANTASRATRVQHDHAHQRTPQAAEWLQFVQAILTSGGADTFGLLLHWYSGALDSERIELSDRQSIRSGTLDADFFLGLSEDILYEFRA